MSVERRPDEKVLNTQKARDKTSLGSQSLFRLGADSAPLPRPPRRPVSGTQSKPPLPSSDELSQAIREWRGDEGEPPVERSVCTRDGAT